MSFYPLTEILLYIALFFAPPDATHVRVRGPDFSMDLDRSGSAWTTGTITFLASDGQLTRDDNTKRQVQAVGDYVKAALDHDWTTVPKIILHDATSLEKTPAGFVVRTNDGDPSARSYTITYRQFISNAAASSAPAPARSLTINVLGRVSKPGAYSLPAGATLLDALAASGGGAPAANLSHLSIVRGPAGEKPAVIVHNAEAILRGQATNPPLLDHDTLFIPERIQ